MIDEKLNIPVLFLIFNRPDSTKKVFQRIREIQPKRLYVSADGPRLFKENEKELCDATRKIIEKVDWDCEVKTRFSEVNQGCKVGVSSGIDWFFENEEEGIILEDDCLPDLSFFPFCAAMLSKYKNEERIMHIGGANFQDGNVRGLGSYYFSNINHVWGWATWKRAWEKYDVTISSFPEFKKQNALAQLYLNPRIEKYWEEKYELAYNNKIDTWDIQWQYAMSANKGLAIIPNKNLVSNIGFDDVATHTVDKFNKLANIPAYEMSSILHPAQIVPDLKADAYAFRKYFAPTKMRKIWYLALGIIKTYFKINN